LLVHGTKVGERLWYISCAQLKKKNRLGLTKGFAKKEEEKKDEKSIFFLASKMHSAPKDMNLIDDLYNL
jgi:hypothetical protein